MPFLNAILLPRRPILGRREQQPSTAAITATVTVKVVHKKGHCATAVAVTMPNVIKPFQLLEINIISGQDLELVSKKMRTYATAWVHPKRKLSTVVDTQGYNNPTWNDKFVFRVDEEFLRLDTSAVTIEIHAVGWFRDTLVGTVRVLVGNLVPPPPSTRPHRQQNHHTGMRFAALQVWRPSGRPQGLLNIGVAVLDSSMRSMPLYTQLSRSAVGYRDLIGQENPQHQHQDNNHDTNDLPLMLRRWRSERTESVTTFDDLSATHGSIVGMAQKKGPSKKASSRVSDSSYCSNIVPNGKSKKGKASSVISGTELITKPKEKGRKGKGSSLVNLICSFENAKMEKPPSLDPPKEKVPNDPKICNNQAQVKPQDKALTKRPSIRPAMEKPNSKPNGFEFGGPKGSSIASGKYMYRAPPKPQYSFWSESEVGPSPSEVAAAGMAREREKETGRYPFDDNHSSVLEGWSVDESMEGLQSKLERWRTELPALYDRGGGFASSSFRSTGPHVKRKTDDGTSGLFSCFSSIYGYECQCICGKPPERKRSLSLSDRS
ncbi:hypothetical protein RHSIM_Rhsim02G0044200 [Rhododendron simsii]|uniref:C2 domain-containing protein n=1 Tax=Rhododendron simsii TaxID=118357 RepID=A0A834HF88_RHOSS|nr:hypothetical protein RHSIM_Rhsim02G0044200 [Rhododendron simsii]